MLIAISGMIASGKTTLVENLSAISAWDTVLEPEVGLSYLPQLFSNPERWAFEAQVAFLIGKMSRIKILSGCNVLLLDRSLEEDAKIFFDYFSQFLTPNSISIFASLYQLLNQRDAFTPQIQILCHMSLEEVYRRVDNRENAGPGFPKGYVEEIYFKYEEYAKARRHSDTVFFLDSQRLDWRDINTCKDIYEDLKVIMRSKSSKQKIQTKLKALQC